MIRRLRQSQTRRGVAVALAMTLATHCVVPPADAGNRGEVKWVRDARYGTTGEQFEYTYNSYGQKLTETNLKNVVTEYTYGDTWGNLTQVVQDPAS